MSQKSVLEHYGEIDRLALMATRIRLAAIKNITKSKVGHPGGSLSVTDILTVLYFGRTYDAATGVWQNIMRYDAADPLWVDRDRFVLSKGHAAPALYATLAEAGFFSKALLDIYRKIDSPLEGHPAMYRVFEEAGKRVEHGTKGVDFSTGSLGHGLSAAAGMALHAKVYGHDYQAFVVMGDGDLQEGMTWEACLTIPNKNLNNVCGIIDYNHLQVDGSADDINPLFPLEDKFKAFNWDVRVVDGHDLCGLVDALHEFKTTRRTAAKPMMIIANTIKGKGVPLCENDFSYHAVPLTEEEFAQAEEGFLARIAGLEEAIAARELPAVVSKPLDKQRPAAAAQDLAAIVKQNPAKDYPAPTATRVGYGNALARLGEYENLFVLNADLAGACGANAFVERYPETAAKPSDRRSINVGVQEANMMTMAAALASCGKLPVVNSFGIFSTGRAWEMVRQDIAYPRLNVKIIGSHTGAGLGEYGVSHQAIEDVGCMRVLPHLAVVEPSDAVQADLLLEQVLAWEGPLYFRLGRNPSPIFYREGNAYGVPVRRDFQIGKGYVVREGQDLTLICSGPILEEALKVADLVTESVRVIDMPTIRPLDAELVATAARETGRICTVHDHFENGGLNEEVLQVLQARRLAVQFDAVALAGFAESGSKADLYEKYGLSAKGIIKKLQLTLKS